MALTEVTGDPEELCWFLRVPCDLCEIGLTLLVECTVNRPNWYQNDVRFLNLSQDDAAGG